MSVHVSCSVAVDVFVMVCGWSVKSSSSSGMKMLLSPILKTSFRFLLVTLPLGSCTLYDMGGKSGDSGSKFADLHSLSYSNGLNCIERFERDGF